MQTIVKPLRPLKQRICRKWSQRQRVGGDAFRVTKLYNIAGGNYYTRNNMVRRRYPIGIQTFSEIINNGYVYVDKTAYVYKMAHEDGKFFFLSRPRRFGKSLLTSTLESYFAGQKNLFKGLAIDKLERDWTAYPVLHFDLSGAKHTDKEMLLRYLDYMLAKVEKIWNISNPPAGENNRLSNVIDVAYRQTGKPVVVLIDEYDAPLLDVVHSDEKLSELRQVMRNFYSPLKLNEPYLRFAFLTGVTKFSQLSIFSELNNIVNISMRPDYAGICGITKEEVLTQMFNDIDMLAQATGESRQKTIDDLTQYYDGYHFAWPSPDIFNPYSLLNAFSAKDIDAYWFSSGTPTYLIEMMHKFHVMPTQIGRLKARNSDFDAPTETMTSLTPLFYQSGYLTIKGYNKFSRIYTLDVPNREVELGLMQSFIPYYVTPDTATANVTLGDMAEALCEGDMDRMLHLLQDFLATIPYTDNTQYEGHYQQVLCIIFRLLGTWADVEVHTPHGRVDVVMQAFGRLYIIELKLDASAETAMRQIDLRDYAEAFSHSGLPVTKVAVNFDSTTRNLKDWKIA